MNNKKNDGKNIPDSVTEKIPNIHEKTETEENNVYKKVYETRVFPPEKDNENLSNKENYNNKENIGKIRQEKINGNQYNSDTQTADNTQTTENLNTTNFNTPNSNNSDSNNTNNYSNNNNFNDNFKDSKYTNNSCCNQNTYPNERTLPVTEKPLLSAMIFGIIITLLGIFILVHPFIYINISSTFIFVSVTLFLALLCLVKAITYFKKGR